MSESTSEKSQHKYCCLCGGVAKENYNDGLNNLQNQITTYFVGVKILEYSSRRCADLLEMEGNPFTWFDFCEECFKKVNEAEKTFKQFLKLESKWKSLKEEIGAQIIKWDRKKNLKQFDQQENILINGQQVVESSDDDIKIETLEEEIKVEDEELRPQYIACDNDYMSFDDDDDYSQSPCEMEMSDRDPLSLENASTLKDNLNRSESFRHKCCQNFTDEETKNLLEIWSLEKFQVQFLKTKHPDKIWNQISSELFKAGQQNDKSLEFPYRAPVEVRNRLENMKDLFIYSKKYDPDVKKKFPFYDLFEKTFENRSLLSTSFGTIEDIDTLDETAAQRQMMIKRCPNSEETMTMMGIWSSEEFQTQFQNSRSSEPVWNSIAARLFEVGKLHSPTLQYLERTGLEVRNIFKNVKSKYVRIKKSTDPSVNKEGFPYYDIFDKTYEKFAKYSLPNSSSQYYLRNRTVNEASPLEHTISKEVQHPYFTKDETDTLLKIWSSDKIQEHFRNSNRSNSVWDIVTEQLFEAGQKNTTEHKYPLRKAQVVKNRFLNVKRHYFALSPEKAEDFPYYNFFKYTWTSINSASKELNFGLACEMEQKRNSILQTIQLSESKSDTDATVEDAITSDMCDVGEPKKQFDRVKAPRKTKLFPVPISEEDDIKFETLSESKKRNTI